MDTLSPPATLASPSSGCADACCDVGPTSPARPDPERSNLIRRAFLLEYATLAWMAVEAAVAVWSGIRAGSVSLLAFGVDSIIEIASAGVLIWRLTVELQQGRAFAETAERTAGRICGGLLLVLAGYVVAAAAWSLWTRSGETFSWPGLAVTGLAMPVMYLLARRKLALAARLGSRALRADAMEAVTCGWLSLVVVVGLAAQALTGAWWVDAVTSLGVVWFLVKEGREAWNNDGCSCG